MKPETERYLDKARQALREARAVAGIDLAEAAVVLLRQYASGYSALRKIAMTA